MDRPRERGQPSRSWPLSLSRTTRRSQQGVRDVAEAAPAPAGSAGRAGRLSLLATKQFRLGVCDEDANDYHCYITNLSQEEIIPCDIATIYRCRWEVELLFQELKTWYEPDEHDEETRCENSRGCSSHYSVSEQRVTLYSEYVAETRRFHQNAGRRPSSRMPNSSYIN